MVLHVVVVVVSGPVATTITPVPVEEVEGRAAREAAKPTERGGGWAEEEVGGGGRGTGVVGVPAVRKESPSLLEELMMERRRARPPEEVLSPPKQPLSPSREAWDSLYPGEGRLPLLRRFESPLVRLGRLSHPEPPPLLGVPTPPDTPSILTQGGGGAGKG